VDLAEVASLGFQFSAQRECLGHSTVAITLDVYSHVTPAMNREAARAMDELLAT
jgi:integrase